MISISIPLDDESHTVLMAICAKQGREPAELVGELLHHYLAAAQKQQGPPATGLAALDPELASEAVALAEAGMEDYQDSLRKADEP